MLISNSMKKTRFVLDQFRAVASFLKNYRWLEEISKKSLLADRKLFSSSCLICGNKKVSLLAKIPLGIPGYQNHSFLYFNKNVISKDLLYKKAISDLGLGFFLSVPFFFCNNCKNASLGITLKDDHLLQYYSSFYERKNPSCSKRRITKELHGKFVSSLFHRKSTILEIGSAEGYSAAYLIKAGHEVYAYEPSSINAALKETRNLKFVRDIKGDIGVLFDAVYMHHVLEHISNPIAYLKKLHAMLKKDGIICIQVPDLSLQVGILEKNIRRYAHSFFNHPVISYKDVSYNFNTKDAYNWFDAFLNDHVSAFSPEGISFVLKSSGYAVENVIQSTKEKIKLDLKKYSWAIDEATGNTPNGLTIVGRKL